MLETSAAPRRVALYLRERRHAQALSLTALSARTAIPRSRIHRIETGERDPGLDELARLAEGLGVNPYTLFAFLGWDAPPPGQAPRRRTRKETP